MQLWRKSCLIELQKFKYGNDMVIELKYQRDSLAAKNIRKRALGVLIKFANLVKLISNENSYLAWRGKQISRQLMMKSLLKIKTSNTCERWLNYWNGMT